MENRKQGLLFEGLSLKQSSIVRPRGRQSKLPGFRRRCQPGFRASPVGIRPISTRVACIPLGSGAYQILKLKPGVGFYWCRIYIYIYIYMCVRIALNIAPVLMLLGGSKGCARFFFHPQYYARRSSGSCSYCSPYRGFYRRLYRVI